MIAYFLATGFVAGLFFLGRQVAGQTEETRHVSYFDSLGIAVLALFSGLRYGIGTDYFLYARIWELHVDPSSLPASIDQTGQEVGFVTLAAALKGAGLEFETFILLVSILTVVTASSALWLLSERPRISILLFVVLGPYLSSMNIVRQGLAAALILLWYALWKRRLLGIWKWIFAAVACSMHYSAILIIPLIVLVRLSLTKSPRHAAPALLALAAIGFMVTVGADTLPSLVELLNPRYSTYLGASDSGLGTWMNIAVRLTVVVWVAARMHRARILNEWLPEIALVSLGALFLSLGFVSTPIARMDAYLWPFAAVLIPTAMGQDRASAPTWMALAALGIVHMAAYLASFGGLLPYASVVMQ